MCATAAAPSPVISASCAPLCLYPSLSGCYSPSYMFFSPLHLCLLAASMLHLMRHFTCLSRSLSLALPLCLFPWLISLLLRYCPSLFSTSSPSLFVYLRAFKTCFIRFSLNVFWLNWRHFYANGSRQTRLPPPPALLSRTAIVCVMSKMLQIAKTPPLLLTLPCLLPPAFVLHIFR